MYTSAFIKAKTTPEPKQTTPAPAPVHQIASNPSAVVAQERARAASTPVAHSSPRPHEVYRAAMETSRRAITGESHNGSSGGLPANKANILEAVHRALMYFGLQKPPPVPGAIFPGSPFVPYSSQGGLALPPSGPDRLPEKAGTVAEGAGKRFGDLFVKPIAPAPIVPGVPKERQQILHGFGADTHNSRNDMNFQDLGLANPRKRGQRV